MSKRMAAAWVAALLCGLLLAGIVLAAGAQSYAISCWTVGGGGATLFSTSESYALGSTIGQPGAGAMSGGGYTLASGFWGGVTTQYRTYLPLVVRQY